MSPVIRISDKIFKRLQKYAKPLVDTPGSVIEKILDHYENCNDNLNTDEGLNNEVGNEVKNNLIILDPENPLDLTHTKIISANYGSHNVDRWNKLVDIAHIEAMKVTNSFEELKNISISQISNGKKLDKGFRYLEKINISVQGENANKTWISALNLAKHFKKNVKILFIWRSNKKSLYPSKKGLLEWKPSK